MKGELYGVTKEQWDQVHRIALLLICVCVIEVFSLIYESVQQGEVPIISTVDPL